MRVTTYSPPGTVHVSKSFFRRCSLLKLSASTRCDPNLCCLLFSSACPQRCPWLPDTLTLTCPHAIPDPEQVVSYLLPGVFMVCLYSLLPHKVLPPCLRALFFSSYVRRVLSFVFLGDGPNLCLIGYKRGLSTRVLLLCRIAPPAPAVANASTRHEACALPCALSVVVLRRM